MAKIGINGFGRLGRLLLKVAIEKCKEKSATELSKVLMVNDPKITPECLSYLLKNDSFRGKSNLEIVEMGSSLMIDGQRVEITTETKIEKIPWNKGKVECVIDTTGQNSNCKNASKFITEGVKRVIVTGCSNVPIFVVGVNHACYELDMKTVSAGLPVLNCLLPVLRVLHENFVVQEAMITSLEPLSNKDKILDDLSSSSSCKSGRSSIMSFATMESSVKQETVNKIMPELQGKTQSTAIKIPVPCVGAIHVTARVGREAPYEVVKCRLKEASETYMKGVMRYTDENLISTDLIGDPHSCVVDGTAGVALSKCLIKIFAWYDSELGFANRLYDLASYMASRENCPK